jgi:hypothetical protein
MIDDTREAKWASNILSATGRGRRRGRRRRTRGVLCFSFYFILFFSLRRMTTSQGQLSSSQIQIKSNVIQSHPTPGSVGGVGCDDG